MDGRTNGDWMNGRRLNGRTEIGWTDRDLIDGQRSDG